MKDVDRSKVYNSQKETAADKQPNPGTDDKELLVLEARLEKATGEDRTRIEGLIREILDKREKEGRQPHTPS